MVTKSGKVLVMFRDAKECIPNRVCISCKKPKRRRGWECAKCHSVLVRLARAGEKKLQAKKKAAKKGD